MNVKARHLAALRMIQVERIFQTVYRYPGISATSCAHLIKPGCNRYFPATVLRELHRLVNRGRLRAEQGDTDRGWTWFFYPI